MSTINPWKVYVPGGISSLENKTAGAGGTSPRLIKGRGRPSMPKYPMLFAIVNGGAAGVPLLKGMGKHAVPMLKG